MDFPGKILLFGEYGILLGSMALAVPFFRFSGRFRFAEGSLGANANKEFTSRAELGKLCSYLKSAPESCGFLNLHSFEEELERGLFFDSSIPTGSGLGSSGALTAAVYARYAHTPHAHNQAETRKRLAFIEACFHGSSSGIDPLTSYYKKTVLLENPTQKPKVADISLFLENFTLFLISTHHKGHTGKLVANFKDHCREPAYRKRIDAEFIPLINQTIEAIVGENFESFESSMKNYSSFQLLYFGNMIPVDMGKHMEYGIESGDFNLKLCGSGGGGYMLAISQNRKKAECYFKENQLDYQVVNHSEIEQLHHKYLTIN